LGPTTDGTKDKWTPTEASTSRTQEDKEGGQGLLDLDEEIMHLSECVMTIRGLLVTLEKEKDAAHVLLKNIDQRIEAGVERRSVLKVNAESAVALKRQFDNLTREQLLAALRHLNVGKFDSNVDWGEQEEAWKDKLGRNRSGGELRLKAGYAPKRELTERLVAYFNLDSEVQTVGTAIDGMKDKWAPTEAPTSRTQEDKHRRQGLLDLNEEITHLSASVMTTRGLLVTLDKEKDAAHVLLENIDQRVVAGVERLSILNVNAESGMVALRR
jgi:hypothetical protein